METLAHGKYFGDTLHSKSINGIVLTEKFHAEGEDIPLHAHENTYICTVIQGNWEKYLKNKLIPCSPLKSIFHLPNEEHTDKFLKTSRVFDIEINNEWYKHLKNHPLKFSSAREFTNDKVNWLSAKIYYEFKHNKNDSALVFEETLIDLMTSLASYNNHGEISLKAPSWLKNTKEYIEENYQRSINFSEIANDIDLHPGHLIRSFRKYYNTTMSEYQRFLKVKLACQKLVFTDLPLLEVAIESGFYDQSHFYRIFRKHLGLLPNIYRNLFKK